MVPVGGDEGVHAAGPGVFFKEISPLRCRFPFTFITLLGDKSNDKEAKTKRNEMKKRREKEKKREKREKKKRRREEERRQEKKERKDYCDEESLI